MYCRVWESHGMGGMQVVAANNARILAQKGHEVHFFTTPDTQDFEVKSYSDISGLYIHHVKSPVKKYSTEYFDSAYEKFQEIGSFDIIYSHSTAARRHLEKTPNIPIIAHWHGIGSIQDNINLKKIGIEQPEKKFDMDILKYPNHIVCGKHEGDLICSYGGRRESISIIRHTSNKVYPKNPQKTRNKLAIKDDEFIIGMCGRMSASDKGGRQIIDILDRIFNFSDKIRVLMVGDNWTRLNYGDRIINVERVDNTEMVDYYNSIDLLLDLTARNQGFDMVTVEAALCGTPLLVSDVGGYREEFGSNAKYFELGNREDLFDKISQAFNTGKYRLEVDKLSKFSYNYVGSQLESILKNLINKN